MDKGGLIWGRKESKEMKLKWINWAAMIINFLSKGFSENLKSNMGSNIFLFNISNILI